MTVFDATDYNAPPTALHVELFLKGATFWPTDAVKQLLAQYSAQLAIDAALDEWETLTGHFPFLADAAPSTRTVTVDAGQFSRTGVLQLGGGIVELSSVQAISSGGAFSGTNWIQKPDNAVIRKRPVTWLKWIGHRGTMLFSALSTLQFAVTARWGYADKFPPIAFQAIVARAAVQLLRQSENLQSIASVAQDGFSKEYDVVGILTQKDVAQGGDKDFVKLAEMFRLVVV